MGFELLRVMKFITPLLRMIGTITPRRSIQNVCSAKTFFWVMNGFSSLLFKINPSRLQTYSSKAVGLNSVCF